MEILQIVLLIGVFLVMAVVMFTRKIPALLALPLMAILIGVIGGVYPRDIIQYIVGAGSLKLYNAYTVAMFGSMLSVILQKTGVAESFIKKGAELAGDNPLLIAVLMLLLIMVLFSTLGGLGAIIMVATIVLPIMSSVGVGPVTAVGIFLFGLSIGGILNVGNWAVYVSVMGLKVEQIRPFALLMVVLAFICAVAYITIQLYRDGQDINLWKVFTRMLLALLVLVAGWVGYTALLPEAFRGMVQTALAYTGNLMVWLVGLFIALLFALALLRLRAKDRDQQHEIYWIAYFSPLIPLVLILLFNIDFVAAFITGMVFAFLSTYKTGRLNLFMQSCLEGGGVVMPAVILMFGIGMLLVAIMGPGGQLTNYPDGWPVLNLLKPLMTMVVPRNAVTYILIFSCCAPLALYRGPLNVWGMGYGLAAVFLASGLNPGAVMGLLMAVGQVQGISDPTNTHNIWLANEMRVDVQKILWNTLPYTWIVAILGIAAAAILYM